MNMDDNRVFEIPSPNLSKFQDKWERLVRRADKLGIIPPTYSIIKEEPRPIKLKKERWNEVKGGMETYYEEVAMIYHHVVIDHPKVQVPGGWEFVASLEHTEEGNITHNIGGQDLPAQYRDCEPWCDHCQLRRNRKDTFVVVDPQQQYRQIGRNCLAEYLGVDGTIYANMAEIYYSASETAEASSGDSWGGTGPWLDYLEPYLSHVAEVISIKGWLSRKIARDCEAERGHFVPSTSDIALRHMHPGPYEKHVDRLYDEPTGKSEELAKAAIEWCENLPDSEVENSEYLHNIRIIARRGIIGAKQYGFAASIVSGYQRSLTDALNREREAKERIISQHVGTIGKRDSFVVVVEKVLALESNFGSSHLHMMKDDKGNSLKWFSTGKVFDIGVPLLIKATPKKHDEFKGIKQTILSRCALVEAKS
jgi:hypothetical protein